jgi:hypothetical protein
LVVYYIDPERPKKKSCLILVEIKKEKEILEQPLAAQVSTLPVI